MADNILTRMFKRTKTGKEVGSRREQIEKALGESNEAQEYKDEQTRKKEDKAGAPKPYKKGGFVRSADGIAQRGKTKGRMV